MPTVGKTKASLPEKKSLLDATEHVANIYLELRSSGISPQHKAQRLALRYLGELTSDIE